MADDQTHARQRRALSHAFSTKALLEQEYIVRSYIDVFSKKMQEFASSGETVDIVEWFSVSFSFFVTNYGRVADLSSICSTQPLT